MEKSFDGNPAVHFSIGSVSRADYNYRRRKLAEFMYDFCKRRNGVFLSSDQNAVICYYHSDYPVSVFQSLKDEISLAWNGIGLSRLYRVWRRSNRIAQKQKGYRPFIHCWYIGAKEGERNGSGARELRNRLFEESRTTQRAILAETTMLQNKKVYEWLGFEVYDTVSLQNMTTYLLVKQPT